MSSLVPTVYVPGHDSVWASVRAGRWTGRGGGQGWVVVLGRCEGGKQREQGHWGLGKMKGQWLKLVRGQVFILCFVKILLFPFMIAVVSPF